MSVARPRAISSLFRLGSLALAGAALLVITAIPALATPGALDPTFGNGGIVTTNAGNGSWSTQIAIQSDGKIVAAGKDGGGSNSQFLVARYNGDGSLDTTFGPNHDGIYILGNGIDKSEARAVAIQSDGKILAAGYQGADYMVVRLNPDGSLDPTWGGTGIVITDISGQDSARSVIPLASGKVLVSGWSVGATTGQDFSIVRYRPDGSLDLPFGGTGTGTATTDFGGNDQARGMVVQSNGSIVVGGYSKTGTGTDAVYDFALVRYLRGGRVDTTYGPNGNGEVLTNLNATAGMTNVIRAVVIQPDGKVVAGGYVGVGGGLSAPAGSALDVDDGRPPSAPAAPADWAIARYKMNGSLDPTFGTSGPGYTITDLGSSDHCRGLAMTAAGQFVTAGNTSNASGDNDDFAIARYNHDGSLDTSFGITAPGWTQTEIGGTADGARDVKIDANGNYVADGISGGFNGFLIAMARYLPA